MSKIKLFALLMCCASSAFAATGAISTDQLQGYENNPPATQDLIQKALALSREHLRYRFGSANPHRGGMDCSGVIYYLLREEGIEDVPRQSNQMYQWVSTGAALYAIHNNDFSSEDFSQLKPGDLLFWSGTYHVKRFPSVTHVMLYLGQDKDNKPLMFGSSDGRTYRGKPLRGVGVFEFELPKDSSVVHFEGYSCIPRLTC